MKRCALSHWLPPPSAALMLLLFAPLATADLASAVAGLSPGAQYRVVFITQSTRDAFSTMIDDYDAPCNCRGRHWQRDRPLGAFLASYSQHTSLCRPRPPGSVPFSGPSQHISNRRSIGR